MTSPCNILIDNHRYEEIEKWCHDAVKNGHLFLFDSYLFDSEINKVSREFGFPQESLTSFLRNVLMIRIKKHVHIIRNDSIIQHHYMKGESIISIAKRINYPPTLTARAILEKICDEKNKKQISRYLKEPLELLRDIDIIKNIYRASEKYKSNYASNSKVNTCVDGEVYQRVDSFTGENLEIPIENTTRLAIEVLEAVDIDPLHGPISDKERNFIGLEYELILEQSLRSMNIPFETEGQLRARGTSKTPDILFSFPVAIKIPKENISFATNNNKVSDSKLNNSQTNDDDFIWKMICWIDSKALFGDVHTHQTSVLPQAASYVNRFGPGLILYWFGHAPLQKLDNGHGDIVVTGFNVPQLFMLPTGDLIGCNHE